MSKIVEMNRLDSHPLAARFYDMSRTIEALGGSPELTDALTSLHALRQEVEDELNRLFTEVGWKKDRSHGIFVEESRELDSGDMMGFFARGHYERYKFAEACNEYTGADPYYDRRYVHANDCRHEWWRTVPVSGEPGVVSYHTAEPHSRGAFAVTVTHVVEDRQRKQTQRWIDEHNKGRAAGFAEGLNWALHKLDRINPDAGEELLREYRERDNTQKSTKATPSPQTNLWGSDHPATSVEEFYEGDEVAYLRDTLKEVTRERDHFHNQWRACWAPLTPRSENEKQGFERVLAILKSKLSDGGGIVGPSEVQRAHNDFYRGRRVAFEECANMLRAALATEGKA